MLRFVKPKGKSFSFPSICHTWVSRMKAVTNFYWLGIQRLFNTLSTGIETLVPLLNHHHRHFHHSTFMPISLDNISFWWHHVFSASITSSSHSERVVEWDSAFGLSHSTLSISLTELELVAKDRKDWKLSESSSISFDRDSLSLEGGHGNMEIYAPTGRGGT